MGTAKQKSMGREVEGISRVINMLMSFYFFRSYSGESVKEVYNKV